MNTQRLASVLARLASPYDGERAAAGLLASRMVREAGLSWHDLLRPAAAPHSADWRSMLAECRRRPALLTSWESEFVASLAGFARPSPRQLDVLRRIVERISGGEG